MTGENTLNSFLTNYKIYTTILELNGSSAASIGLTAENLFAKVIVGITAI